MSDVRVSFPNPCAQEWDTMTPIGCDRVCARCDTIVHDLSAYTFDEAEGLLRSHPNSCVRAQIDRAGAVVLKPGRKRNARRMVIAIGASVGLFGIGEAASAGQKHAEGTISGRVNASDSGIVVMATSSDGQTFRTHLKNDGRYAFKRMPTGRYKLAFIPTCGDRWSVEDVTVKAGVASVSDTVDPRDCIVVGLLRIDNHKG